MTTLHIPVLLNDILSYLIPDDRVSRRVIDGTLGAGGHTHALLEAGVDEILGLDVDSMALEIAEDNLREFGNRVHIVHSSYGDMLDVAGDLGWDCVDGILLDLGVSSMQLDTAERGFAFMKDGPLDMRFNPSGNHPPASELVNYWDENELVDVFYKYGEERHSRRIARAVVKNRPYETTSQLVSVLIDAMPRSKNPQRIHPATRVFQALRIAVNDELRIIEKVLPEAIDLLCSKGRLAVISFHSLEDRIVKQAFKEASIEIVSPPGMMLEERNASIRLLTRKPVVADDDEIRRNPRSRSAKLRVVEKT